MADHYLKLASALLSVVISCTAVASEAQDSMATKQIAETTQLTPNLENGKKVFYTCALCHSPEGWGTTDGTTPEIAGQLSSVIIKQLTDIRLGNRDNPTMIPFTTPVVMSLQDIVDVAAYLEQLKMASSNLTGPGNNLEHGKKLYIKECAECHGKNGEGDAKEFYPKIHGQNYNYLLRQMHWIKDGKRRNANRNMVNQIKRFTDEDITAVIDYSSRLRPDPSKVAEKGWTNPDFPRSFMFSPKYDKR
jgi:cytochrome c553